MPGASGRGVHPDDLLAGGQRRGDLFGAGNVDRDLLHEQSEHARGGAAVAAQLTGHPIGNAQPAGQQDVAALDEQQPQPTQWCQRRTTGEAIRVVDRDAHQFEGERRRRAGGAGVTGQQTHQQVQRGIAFGSGRDGQDRGVRLIESEPPHPVVRK